MVAAHLTDRKDRVIEMAWGRYHFWSNFMQLKEQEVIDLMRWDETFKL
jgi:hypothetical protein